MSSSQLIKRSLTHYWQTNIVVVLGVAVAVGVLAGALLVGDSVRGSLRDLFLQRVGEADLVISGTSFFREQLASEIQNNQQFTANGFKAACPIIAIDGSVTHETSHSLASNVRVYGVDERFWKFHFRNNPNLGNREVLVSDSLANELGTSIGDGLLIRVQKPSDIPIESLHSKKEELGRVLRVTVRATLSPEELGEFSVRPQQSSTRAVFVPLRLLQSELEQDGRANLILIGLNDHVDGSSGQNKTASLDQILNDTATLDDYGVHIRQLTPGQGLSVEHESKLLTDQLAANATKAATSLSLRVVPVLSYLANSIDVETPTHRLIPYSLVTAVDETTFAQLSGNKGSSETPFIVLNQWAARDLGVSVGDSVSLSYYLWQENGQLTTKSAQFQLVNIVPIENFAADRDLVPEYPGITGTNNLADWDPPFPVNLDLVRKQDEEYWDQYRTTPKAFLPLAEAQQLWQTRFGKLTSLRLIPVGDQAQLLAEYGERLKSLLRPVEMGLSVIPIREQGLQASRGATNFGEYFLYFSFFLVLSALLLTALFFKLGVEQRLREIGLLYAIGFSGSIVRKLFLVEALVLSIVGSLIGITGAIVYGQLMMTGLSTWWVKAVGTTALKLHIAPLSLVIGGVSGVVAALIFVALTLRSLGKASARSLLTGSVLAISEEGTRLKRPRGVVTVRRVAHLFGILGLALLAAAIFGIIGQVSGFFGGGLCLLTSMLCYQSTWLRRRPKTDVKRTGWWSVMRLGFRNARYRPARSVLCIALIASASFIIVSVEAFRRSSEPDSLDRKSGTGGFPLLAESVVPLAHDPNIREGRESLNLTNGTLDLSNVNIARFRLRPGDDASCLNLYQPRNPRIIAPRNDFLESNRFSFGSSIAGSAAENNNPWLLLNGEFPDGAVPIIADANSLTYVLHLKLGEDLVLQNEGNPVRLRVVAALSDSIFQSELIMSEANFLRLFPGREGYRFFLIDSPPGQTQEIANVLEDRLSDFGFDVTSAPERLASFHQVENTYLSTFQMLGGLGLVLGTLGLSAVLLRNVFEQRRELALLSAIGYNSAHFSWMVIAENALLVGCGIVTGIGCALLAIAPALIDRGGSFDARALTVLLVAVLFSGFIASLIATLSLLRAPLLPALRAE